MVVAIFGKKHALTAEYIADVDLKATTAIRAQDFKLGSQYLQGELKKHGGPFYKPCEKIFKRYAGLYSWETLLAEIQILEQRRSTRITGIGIDVSGHDEGKAVFLEISFYDNQSYPFSRYDRAKLLRDLDAGTMPWRGGFIDIIHTGRHDQRIPSLSRGHGSKIISTRRLDLSIPSLSVINGKVKAYPHQNRQIQAGQPLPPDYAGYRLAKWYLLMRIHQAIDTQITKLGTPRDMPVIVGTHDFGEPYFFSAYMSKASNAADKKVKKILNRQDKKAKTEYDKHTKSTLKDMAFRRKSIMTWDPGHNPNERATFMNYTQQRDAMILSVFNIPNPGPSWLLTDAQYQALEQDIIEARARWNQTISMG